MAPCAVIRSISPFMSSRALCAARHSACCIVLAPGYNSIRLRTISKMSLCRVLSDNFLRDSSRIPSQLRESSLSLRLRIGPPACLATFRAIVQEQFVSLLRCSLAELHSFRSVFSPYRSERTDGGSSEQLRTFFACPMMTFLGISREYRPKITI